MKRNLLMLAVLASCATQVAKDPVSTDKKPVDDSSSRLPVEVSFPKRVYKAPKIILPVNPSEDMIEAVKIFAENAQEDEFYDYVRKNVKALAGGNETNVEVAITKMRDCLDVLESVTIKWGNYVPWSKAIGGWDGTYVNQNARLAMNSVERAGHWYHEITHACKFTHVANNISKYPIIRQSWPYQGGYAFEDFITDKRRSAVQLAGE